MRDVTLAGLGATTSCLGFGCASLGSRVSPAQSERALARAHDHGVRWFDVAPAYGAGAAEPLLGAFLQGRRDDVQICTKVGLLPPPQGAPVRLVRSLLRPAVALARPLRAAIRRSGTTANRQVPLTPDLLRASLDRSLNRLRTDYVDVYALHNADPDDLVRDDILRTLQDLLASGKVRTVGVAGDMAAARAALACGAPFGLVQFAQPQGPGDLAAAARAAGIGCVTHTVFGVAGQLAKLTARLKADAGLRTQLADAGYGGTAEDAAAALLMARALACNPAGVVLASMASERSLMRNLAFADTPPDPAAMALCDTIGL
ncbi:MAG: aldo/keto reductase [Alphaproteobacteria bacterium]|nr:aldo/keto reductase [Alphaproteobacteria bacterium]